MAHELISTITLETKTLNGGQQTTTTTTLKSLPVELTNIHSSNSKHNKRQ